MSKKIVIKMRSFKKLISEDLLHLALLITMLKVCPDSLGLRQQYDGYDTGGGVILDQEWTHPSLSLPFIPIKGSTELIERYQEEIIEDLNTLGQFNRFSLLGSTPVQLSAYLVEADHDQCQAQEDNDLDNHTDTDSGISDVENIGSPFSQNSGGESPQHAPHSPCPSSTAEDHSSPVQDEHRDEGCRAGQKLGIDAVQAAGVYITKLDDTVELMEFEDVIRDVTSRHHLHSEVDLGAVSGPRGIHEFQDFYDSELMFDGEHGLAAQVVEYGPEYGPEIPEELAGTGIPDLEDHGAIQYELMHMDEQLMNLDYNIEDLDEAFLKMDEEIAKTISEDDLEEQEDQQMINTFGDIFDSTTSSSRSSWDTNQVYPDIPELLELNAALPGAASSIDLPAGSLRVIEEFPGEQLLNEEADPDFDISSLDKLEAMDESLDNFDLGLLEESRHDIEPLEDCEEDFLRNDVLLSHTLHSQVDQMLMETSAGKKFENTLHSQVFTPETFIRATSDEDHVKDDESLNISVEDPLNISVEDALMQFDKLESQDEIKEEIKEEIHEIIEIKEEVPEIIEIKEEPLDSEEEEIVVVKEIVKQTKKPKKRKGDDKKKALNQNDLIAKVMKESGLDSLEMENLEQIPEPEKVKSELVKDEGVSVEEEEEILHEELLDVVDAAEFEQTLHGAASQVDLNTVYSVRRKGFNTFSLSYQPSFNWQGYRNDHAYTDLKLEPGVEDAELSTWEDEEEDGLARRSRVESESSGYSSEDSRSTRDEKLAEKMGLPYTVYELINCPVERFNKILNDKDMSPSQTKLCKDIRRRGKNKVAAQNCRKRKMETIEELQVQVESVRRRKEQLLRQRQELETERRRWSTKLERIEQFVLGGLGKTVVEYTLQVVDDRVEVSTRIGGAGSMSTRSSRSRQ